MIPNGSPFSLTDAYCRACSAKMRRTLNLKLGIGSVLYFCDNCKYCFESNAVHLNGNARVDGYSEPPAKAKKD